MGILSDLEPKAVFQYFEDICGIPHGSADTKAISDYCVRFAQNHNLRYIQDEKNNVIIFKDGTDGYETSAPVILQGHLDMVCEKETGCDIDFKKDGLRLKLEDGIITAEGTTLGGDDGIAVAYALALLSSSDIPHPPLEIVLTVDEEIGMFGAAALDCSPLKARTMLNLDSEEEGYLLVSCAGGISTVAHLPLHRETISGTKFSLSVTGLQGGHSGVEIDKGRANACRLLGRCLYQLSKVTSLSLTSLQGGLKDNAIPREAYAHFLIQDETAKSHLAECLETLTQTIKQEYSLTDTDIQIALTEEGTRNNLSAWDKPTTRNAIAALINLPCGIEKMSFDIEGLVQTSLNLGILTSNEEEVSFSFAIRSSVETEKEELVDRIRCLMEVLGGTVTCSGEYPAWEYRQDSPLRDLMISVFREQYGREPVIQALHAGLECGLFAGKLPGLDCVSYGPDMKDIHTPKESMDVESVKRTWEYTLEILRRLK